jgi:hypothetical protein
VTLVAPSTIDAGVIVTEPAVCNVTITPVDAALCASHEAEFVAFAVTVEPTAIESPIAVQAPFETVVDHSKTPFSKT